MILSCRGLFRSYLACALLSSYFTLTAATSAAQPSKGGGAPQGGSSTAGDSRILTSWPAADPGYYRERIIQYRAVETTFSGSQPIVLEPVPDSLPTISSPFKQWDKLVIRIDDPNDLFERYCADVLNVNVSSQAGTAENPASLRPSQSTGGGGGASAASIGAGGTSPTLTIVPTANCVPVGTQFSVIVYGVSPGTFLGTQGALVSFNGGAPVATDVNGAAPYTPLSAGIVTVTATVPGIPAQPPPVGSPAGPVPPITLTARVRAYVPHTGGRTYFLPWNERLSPDTAITVSVTALTSALSQDPTGGTAQPVAVLNQTFNHVHSLNTYNIATGIIYSGLRNPSFSRQESSAAVTCPTGSTGCTPQPEMYQTVTTPGSRTVDPALFFTVYAFGRFDAERPWHPWDLKPEPTVGLSLSSPGSDYFVGAMSEVWRGVQLVGGLHEGKINQLVPPLVNDPTSSTAPVTKQVFNHSGFIGITFNISFIQTLFGGKGGS